MDHSDPKRVKYFRKLLPSNIISVILGGLLTPLDPYRGAFGGVGKKWSFAFRGGSVPGRRGREQSLVEVWGTSPLKYCEGSVPHRRVRDQSLIEESGTFN